MELTIGKKYSSLLRLCLGWFTSGVSPFSLSLSLTYNCDSKCKTCNIWKFSNKNTLNVYQWREGIKRLSLNRNIIWVTLTGGNQFLRADFIEIYYYCVRYMRPLFITIPISATLPEKIEKDIYEVCNLNARYGCKTFLNISLDGIGSIHDDIRGKEGAFRNMVKTIDLLMRINKKYNKYISLGFFTVISKYNATYFKDILFFIKKVTKYYKYKFSYGIGLAENRLELFNKGEPSIVPSPNTLLNVIREYINFIKIMKSYFIKKSFLISYAQFLEKNIVAPHSFNCYAGNKCFHITPEGEIWKCAVRGEVCGHILNNVKQEISALVRCFCYHNNYHYVNILSECRSAVSFLKNIYF